MSQAQLSPEEIEKRIQLMKENCPFCKIVSKEIPSHIIFEDDICLAILDINPVANGHLLLMPKEHYMIMPMVPDEVLGHLGVIAEHLTELLMKCLGAQDVVKMIANGAAAGQQSQHYMMHLIPRYEDDDLDFSLSSGKKTLSDEEAQKIVLELKSQLSQQ